MADKDEPWFVGPLPGRPVVVGYDDRDHSRQPLLWAAAEAVRLDVPLLVVHAANYPGMRPGPGLLEPEPGALDADHEVTARGVAEALEAFPALRAAGTTEVTSPADALTAASVDAELLVIGTRGYGRVVGALLGSVAFAVPARAACPVIVVMGEADDRPVPPEHRIVVGTDGSPGAAAAVSFAAERAAAVGAGLEVVTCTGEDTSDREAAEATVRSAAAWLRDATPDVAVTVRVEAGPADRVLVDASADADLVVVGTRGRSTFTGLLLGSVSRAVISGAACPVGVVGTHRPR
jgi:nucleotide-binding universal stress UspA family protein